MLKSITIYSVVLSAMLLFSSCKHTPYGDNLQAGKYYTLRGIKMYCETYGSGKPLLLIHGNGGSISTFSGVIAMFATKYKVIIADSRAQGRSVDQKDSLSFEMIADDYAAMLDQMHIDSVNIAGWSDGGTIALLLAIRHPDKVKKLVASGPNLWPDSSAIEPDVWLSEQKKHEQLKNERKITPKQQEDWKCLLLDMYEPHIALNTLQKIKCPVLIMGGDHDETRQQHLKLIYDHIPEANYWIIPHSGHGTIFEHKYKFVYEVNKFFTIDFNKSNQF